MTDSKQILLARAAALISKVAAPSLWKYTDDDGKDIYLPEKKTGTIKSPYSGKSFTAKPVKSTLSDVGKELKKDDAKVKGSLFKYTDADGKDFYLPERITGTLKSPYSGKSFTPKAEKDSLSDVGKGLKEEAQADKDKTAQDKTAALSDKAKAKAKAASEDPVDLASELLEHGDKHPALALLKDAWEEILDAVKKTYGMSKRGIAGKTTDPALVIAYVVPKIRNLAEEAKVVADQLQQRLKP